MKLDVANTMKNAARDMTEAAFQQAGKTLSDTKTIVRETLQEQTAAQMEQIIRKLQADINLTDNDLELIRAWIIGDAIGYVKMENNVPDWMLEYKRLQSVLGTYETQDHTQQELIDLLGILEDATKISYGIANFLKKKERIERFEASIKDGITPEARGMLAQVLQEKLLYPDDYKPFDFDALNRSFHNIVQWWNR